MRHVKAEHMQHDKDLDDEDDLDLEDDPRRVAEHPYHHSMHHHHHHHHQGYGPDDHLKDEVIKSDCSAAGVPIPATKPKIWSLADTAACKTPPPPSHPHHQYHIHHHQQQQQQHYAQQQQHHHQQHQQQHQHHHLSSQSHHHSQQPWLGGGGGGSGGTDGSLSNFALPSSASMSPSSAATAPYSSNSARYGGFLSSSSGGQLHYNPNSSSGSSVSSASSSAAAGFPEVGTDTPPQTPPNMKVATPNGVIQGTPAGYCPGGSSSTPSNGGANPGHYTAAAAVANPVAAGAYMQSNGGVANGVTASFSSRLQNSPHKDFSSTSSQNSILHQHQTTASLPPTEASTAFKPFYKG